MSTITNDSDQRVVSWEPGEPGEPGARRPDDRGRTIRRRVLWAVGAVLIVLLLLAGVVFGVALGLASRVDRIPNAFAGLNDAARPAPGAGQTFLLVGTDSRAPGRSTSVTLATVAPDGSHASLISSPGDAPIDVPGRGPTTLDAAYVAGPSVLVNAVEQLTRVRVDHLAVIDVAGVDRLTDAVGGINVDVAAPTSNDGVAFVAGAQHLDGAGALAYVRQRTGLPGGGFDQVRREQNAVRALINGAVNAGATSNPFLAYDLADTLSGRVSVDDTMSNGELRSLVWQLHGLRTRSIDFVALADLKQGPDLWAAVNAGTVGVQLESHPGSTLPVTPR